MLISLSGALWWELTLAAWGEMLELTLHVNTREFPLHSINCESNCVNNCVISVNGALWWEITLTLRRDKHYTATQGNF
ncbi:hypothetical protein J6590_072061 [Homalodisca vitripennis]|nr:hypothetical protein J6590_072061 [Homalodisca vitripennis]